MIDVIVQRGSGGNRGDDITDPLITEVGVALSRGQVEVDKTAKAKLVQLTAKWRAGILTGQLIEVVDALQGEAWRGKITGIEVGMEGIAVVARMQVERIL